MWGWRGVVVGVAAILAWAAVAGFQSRPAGGLPRGGQAYLAHCALCHGDFGAGDGPLTAWLRANGSPEPARLDNPERMRQLGLRGVQEIVSRGGAHVGRFGTMPAWGPHLGRAIETEVTAWTYGLPTLGATPKEWVRRWLESPAGTVPDGRRAYVLWCSGCHGPRGAGDGYYGPSVRARMQPRNLADASRFVGVTDDSLHVLLSPSGAHATGAAWMPGWLRTLDPATVDAAVAYVRALQRSGVE